MNVISNVANIVGNALPFGKGSSISKEDSVKAIKQVSSDFEKVYTSINKFNSSVNEGVEQIGVHTITLKKKLGDLKKVLTLLDQPGHVSTDAAAKNAEIVKLQDKIRSLKAQGKKDDVAEFEKKLNECNEQFKTLMSPDAAQVQKSAICRNVVGIVESLGQIVFKTVSDQYAVRDSLKAYLISAINARRLGGPKTKKSDKEKKEEKKEDKEEKGTVERMSAALLKHAVVGTFLELGKQCGLELPAEYEADIRPVEKGKTLGGASMSIAETLQKIDQLVRNLNHVSRNEKIDLALVEELSKDVEGIVTFMRNVENEATRLQKIVNQGVVESQAAINVADYEVNPTTFKIPPIRSTDEAISKLKALVKVLHEYLVPSLVATPLVYLQDKDWGMKSHSDFRAARRKELSDLLPHITASMPLDALRECIIDFINVFTQVLHVKVPAMIDVFPDDSTILTRVKWAPARAEMRAELETELEKLQNSKTKNSPNVICIVVQNLVRTAMRFLTYKPIGRPHVFRTDSEWSLVSESKLRFQLRKELLL